MVNERPWVLWRGADGTLVVLADYCPHRGPPLSEGKVEGWQIMCPYHGWEFIRDGACNPMPALEAVPGGILARRL